MTIGLWQIPVLVGAGIVLLTYLVSWIAGMRQRSSERRPKPEHTAAVRTISLAALSVALFVLLVIAVQAVGTSAATNLAALASLVLEGAALRWTYLSYRATKQLTEQPASPSSSEPVHASEPPG